MQRPNGIRAKNHLLVKPGQLQRRDIHANFAQLLAATHDLADELARQRQQMLEFFPNQIVGVGASQQTAQHELAASGSGGDLVL